jgi:adenylate cyclase
LNREPILISGSTDCWAITKFNAVSLTGRGLVFKVAETSKKTIRRIWRRRLIHASVLVGTGLLFTLVISLVQPFYTFNLWFADQFLAVETPTSNIVIAGIDDNSLNVFGKWSQWPRSLHSQAITNLVNAGASVVGYDVIFADSSPDDEGLAATIKQAGKVVLAGAGTGVPTYDHGLATFSTILLPTTLLLQASSNVGHVDIIPDPDGKVRQIPLIIEGPNGSKYQALSLAVLSTLFHQAPTGNYPIVNDKLNLLSRDIPVDSEYFMRLNFAVDNGDIPVISYTDIVNNSFDPSLVKNKIILVGMTATGDVDTFAVPDSSIRVPGVLLHAAAMDTILRMSFLEQTGLPLTVAIMIALTLVCALILPVFGTWYWTDILKGVGLVIGLLFSYVVICSLVASHGAILNVLYPALTLVILSGTNTTFIALREQTDKSFVKGLFGRYVSPDVSKQIVSMASEGTLKLGGEERQVSVLFADIRGFTQMSEGLEPEAVVQMLNRFLPVVIDAVVRNGGMVNKFAGDNIMGVWNAPRSESDHARLAVNAALEAQQKVSQVDSVDSKCGFVQFGIGINTGTAIAGNIGATGRAEYTVIGDTVNLASRICSIAPGGQVLIGQDTYSLLKDSVQVEDLGLQNFKGKAKPVDVYRVLGWNKT